MRTRVWYWAVPGWGVGAWKGSRDPNPNYIFFSLFKHQLRKKYNHITQNLENRKEKKKIFQKPTP